MPLAERQSAELILNILPQRVALSEANSDKA